MAEDNRKTKETELLNDEQLDEVNGGTECKLEPMGPPTDLG